MNIYIKEIETVKTVFILGHVYVHRYNDTIITPYMAVHIAGFKGLVSLSTGLAFDLVKPFGSSNPNDWVDVTDKVKITNN